MYGWIFKQQIRQGFQNISRANFDEVLKVFAPDVHFHFVGNHALTADVHSRESVRAWFDRVHRLFPDLHITPRHIRVTGLPWNVTAITQFDVQATLPGNLPYRNQGIQILRIRLGKIVDDYLIEDTQLLDSALSQIANAGNAEAGATAVA
jgi:ketosteroid isomerase-like protein